MIPVSKTLTPEEIERIRKNCAHVLALPWTVTPKLDAIIKEWNAKMQAELEREERRHPARKPDATSNARLADMMREKS